MPLSADSKLWKHMRDALDLLDRCTAMTPTTREGVRAHLRGALDMLDADDTGVVAPRADR